ncbi:hypothetical protein NDU88_000677 [Pleurodeles waltl]|uniref:Uncharacterized protein n=1 Tax=Pleurodeles waltl TaxID=8319 RepID=A0AAV7SX73_PLEWA|nr:hypothetical protein NDU88_000677 [Pleurodeles waltl]
MLLSPITLCVCATQRTAQPQNPTCLCNTGGRDPVQAYCSAPEPCASVQRRGSGSCAGVLLSPRTLCVCATQGVGILCRRTAQPQNPTHLCNAGGRDPVQAYCSAPEPCASVQRMGLGSCAGVLLSPRTSCVWATQGVMIQCRRTAQPQNPVRLCNAGGRDPVQAYCSASEPHASVQRRGSGSCAGVLLSLRTPRVCATQGVGILCRRTAQPQNPVRLCNAGGRDPVQAYCSAPEPCASVQRMGSGSCAGVLLSPRTSCICATQGVMIQCRRTAQPQNPVRLCNAGGRDPVQAYCSASEPHASVQRRGSGSCAGVLLSLRTPRICATQGVGILCRRTAQPQNPTHLCNVGGRDPVQVYCSAPDPCASVQHRGSGSCAGVLLSPRTPRICATQGVGILCRRTAQPQNPTRLCNAGGRDPVQAYCSAAEPHASGQRRGS